MFSGSDLRRGTATHDVLLPAMDGRCFDKDERFLDTRRHRAGRRVVQRVQLRTSVCVALMWHCWCNNWCARVDRRRELQTSMGLGLTYVPF